MIKVFVLLYVATYHLLEAAFGSEEQHSITPQLRGKEDALAGSTGFASEVLEDKGFENIPLNPDSALRGDIVALTESTAFASEVLEDKGFETIPLNPDSALRDDIVSIIHSPKHSRIKITMKPDTACHSPVFMGRLSGRALAMIRWEKRRSQKIYGYYKAPFVGDYFLEIIAVYCNYDENDMGQCVLSGENHRLTESEVQINVSNAVEMKGYWESSVHIPLYTRWQRQECRGKSQDTERCDSVGSCVPFDRYRFRTYPALMDKYKDLDTSLSAHRYWAEDVLHKPDNWNECIDNYATEVCDICVMGASHSRRLTNYLQEIASVRAGHYGKQFPEYLVDKDIPILHDRCKIVLIGFGQWDLAYLTTPDVFAYKMREMLIKVRDHPKVVGRSLHYNPLGDDKMTCPPKDDRTPPFIDLYNKIDKQMFMRRGREWIDTRWIDGAMWDSARDWNHLPPAVEVVEALYIADKLEIGIFSSERLEADLAV